MKPTVVAIVQARMTSERLPGKPLLSIGEDTVLGKVLKRAKRAKRLDDVVLARPAGAAHEAMDAVAAACGVAVYAGDEHNVLSRYYEAARQCGATHIVRITGDCPLIEPALVDDVIENYFTRNVDYCSNNTERSFPRGFDCEVFPFRKLAFASKNAETKYQKEHVTPYLYQNPSRMFTCHTVKAPEALHRPNYRICVDTEEDLTMVREIFKAFAPRDDMTASEIVNFLDNNPDILKINAMVQQKH